MEVQSYMTLNNLIQINELDGTARLDVYFRLKWQDTRLNTTNIFKLLAKNLIVAQEGIDLGVLMDESKKNDILEIWYFFEACHRFNYRYLFNILITTRTIKGLRIYTFSMQFK